MSRKINKLNNRQMKDMREAFNLFDRDKSGSISSSELKQILVALNFKPTDSLVRDIMKEMDSDGNGSIEFDEFVRVMGDIYDRKFTDEEIRRAFQCYDTDNSGFITNSELRAVLNRLNPNINEKRILDIINKFDLDNDGKISYEEFVLMLQDV